ncbi:hypothetical protein GOBAR_DD31526 [Gossypium barbadense]|nr:hypothetical protein GOBAR_DD31526 [Gossypium barbadense]
MVTLYCRNRSHQTDPIQLFAELADVELGKDFTQLSEELKVQDLVEDFSDPDLDEVSNDIYDKGANDDENVNMSVVRNPNRGIMIRNDPGAHMSNIDLDAVQTFEFLKYPNIVPAHRLTVEFGHEEVFVGQKFSTKEECSSVPWRSVYCILHIAANFHRDYKNANWWRQVVKIAMFCRLTTLIPRIGLKQVNQIDAEHVFVEDVRKTMDTNHQRLRLMDVELYSQQFGTFQVTDFIGCQPGIPPRSYRVDLQNRRCDYGRFQSLCYPSAHGVTACACTFRNVEQYIDEVYTLKCILCVWGNEFPVLHGKCLC